MKLTCKYHQDSNTLTLYFPKEFGAINLSDGSVTTAVLADDSVTTLKIVDDAIEAVKLATASITSEKVATAAIGSSHLQDALVTTAKIASLAVDASRLADLTITAGKLASSCVEASKIANLAVGAAAIASGAIGTAKIADAAIIEAKINNAAVTSAKIFDAAIVSAKIADLAVIEAKIGNLAVNTAQIAGLAVTNLKIADLAVTNAKIESLDAAKITTGYLNANRIEAGSIVLNKITGLGDLATENDLDGVPNGATYSKVLTTAISAGKIVLTSSGVTGTLPTSLSAAKCTDATADKTSTHTANNASHYTGASIGTVYTNAKCLDVNADQTSVHTAANAAAYTGSLIATSYTTAKCTDANADQTSAHDCANPGDYTTSHGQNLGWLIGSTGELTISSGGKLKLNCTDALEIMAAGNIEVLQGGDIVMDGGATGNPSLLRFADEVISGQIRFEQAGNSANYWEMAKKTTNNLLNIIPINLTFPYFTIGDSTHNLGSFRCFVNTHFRVYAGNVNRFTVTTANVNINVSNAVANTVHKGADLGLAASAWDTCYADDFTNVADFYNFDRYDDLTVINRVKGSGVYQNHTGYELIDDKTLPLWLLSKHKKTGDVMYGPDGKPYLSLKACISLAWGAIRQLDKKIEAVNEKNIN